MKKIIYNILGAAAVILMAGSCNDYLTIYPSDKTVEEDFWQSKSDVESMVGGAYKALIATNAQRRMIIWGSYRSDEMNQRSTYNNTELEYITSANILPDNYFCDWSSFYSVINNCNIVIKHAADVVEKDPSFTESDRQVVCSQMKALRALCYFYLVRTFRDVPYSEEAFESDEQQLVMSQAAPDSVLQRCIDNLEEASQYAIKSGTYGSGDWRNYGLMTSDAINALLADIYLWRASVNDSYNDYQQCVNYIDKVINAKNIVWQNENNNATETSENDTLHLIDGDRAMYEIFGKGNSSESILELQYQATSNNGNYPLYEYYYGSSSQGNLMATKLFNQVDANANTANGAYFFTSNNDYRYYNDVYGVGGTKTELSIRKMVDKSETVATSAVSKGDYTRDSYYDTNWIIYRLTDLMLMKAEALTQMAYVADSSQCLSQAFNIVNTVYQRSQRNSQSLNYSNFSSIEQMEILVLTERARELCFEGKRWYDLVRYAYRHMEKAPAYSTILANYGGTLPYIPEEMKNMVVRKYNTGGNLFTARMKTEAHLYFPIYQSEIKANELLKQNPAYATEE